MQMLTQGDRAMSQISFDTIVVVEKSRVSCDGGGGALGHPLVWMEMGSDGQVVCKYCDKCFVLKGGPKDPDVIAKSN